MKTFKEFVQEREVLNEGNPLTYTGSVVLNTLLGLGLGVLHGGMGVVGGATLGPGGDPDEPNNMLDGGMNFKTGAFIPAFLNSIRLGWKYGMAGAAKGWKSGSNILDPYKMAKEGNESNLAGQIEQILAKFKMDVARNPTEATQRATEEIQSLVGHLPQPEQDALMKQATGTMAGGRV